MRSIPLIVLLFAFVNCEPFNPGFSLRSLTHQLSSPSINHHPQHQLPQFNNLQNDLLHQLIQRKSDQLATQLKPSSGPLSHQHPQQQSQRLIHHGQPQQQQQQQQQVTNVQSGPQVSTVPATSDSANLVTDLLANRLAEDRKYTQFFLILEYS